MECGLPFVSVTSRSDQLQGAGGDHYTVNSANLIFIMKFKLHSFCLSQLSKPRLVV